MELKSILFGVGATLMLIITIGGALAAFVGAGTTITVPAGKVIIYYTLTTADAAELRDALCHNYQYQTHIQTLNGLEPNPESCATFADKKIKSFASENVRAYRYYLAEQAINVQGIAVTD